VDAETIREARRLLHELVFNGEARLSTGFMVAPKPEVLVLLWEKIGAKKVEEVVEPTKVEGFTPQQTYRTKEKDRHEIRPDSPSISDFGP
jgi:hypothetical protein